MIDEKKHAETEVLVAVLRSETALTAFDLRQYIKARIDDDALLDALARMKSKCVLESRYIGDRLYFRYDARQAWPSRETPVRRNAPSGDAQGEDQ